MWRNFLLALVCLNFAAFSQAQNLSSQIVAGYQGWFNFDGDNQLSLSENPSLDTNRGPSWIWDHWGLPSSVRPSGIDPSGVRDYGFDQFPNVNVPANAMVQAGFPATPRGRTGFFFSSVSQATADYYAQCMVDTGIDVLGVARFVIGLDDANTIRQRGAVLRRVSDATFKKGKRFMVQYDFSGAPSNWSSLVKNDWIANIEGYTTGANFAKEGTKPAVMLWGVGIVGSSYPGSASEWTDLINWFKNRGVFVLGGVPPQWRTGGSNVKPGFLPVFNLLDMIQPWVVGAYTTSNIDQYIPTMRDDQSYCSSHNMKYMPVLWPGFSRYFSNDANSRTPLNAQPKGGGVLMWRQAFNIKSINGINCAFISSLDEFNEAACIDRTADSSLELPDGKLHFLTNSADGKFYSSDFYLRLTSDLIKMLKGQRSLSMAIPTNRFSGPVFFETSMEAGFDALPDYTTTKLDATATRYVTSNNGQGIPFCGKVGPSNPTSCRDSAVLIEGLCTQDKPNAYSYYRVFDVSIPVTSSTKLRFDKYTSNFLGLFTSIDLICVSGKTLRDSGAIDQDGTTLHATTARGVVGGWKHFDVSLNPYLPGETITKIVVCFDQWGYGTGAFSAKFDNIIIENK